MEESNQQIQPQGFFHFLKTLSLSSWLYTPLDLLPTHGATPQRLPCGPRSQDPGQLQVPPPGPRWPCRFTTAQSKSGPNGSSQPTPLSHEKPFFLKNDKRKMTTISRDGTNVWGQLHADQTVPGWERWERQFILFGRADFE